MTPGHIRQVRQHARGMLDEIGSNSMLRAEMLIGCQNDLMRPHLQQIRLLMSDRPLFFSRFDYAWTLEASSYDTAIEAAWQLRMLRAIAAIHGTKSPHWTEDKLRYGNIVVTYQLIVNYLMAGASFRPYGKLSVVRLPFGFFEIALIILRGILASRLYDPTMQLGDADPSWLAMQGGLNVDPSFFRPYVADLVVRLIAARTDHPDVALPGVVKTISNTDAFSDISGEIGGESQMAFVEDALYLITEFVLFHEVGHALLSDTPTDRSIATEVRADFCATQLFAVSWGWRSELLERTLLDEVGRIVLGPRLALTMLWTWLKIMVEFEERISVLDTSDKFHKPVGLTREALTELDQRIEAVDRSLQDLVQSYAQRGEHFSQKSASSVDATIAAVRQFGSHAAQWIATLPSDVFRAVVSAAR